MDFDPATTACPEDPEIDIDIDGLLVRSFVRHGNGFVAVLGGGSGRWRSSGEMVQVASVTEAEFIFGFASTARADTADAQLDAWSRHATPLRLVGSPGRMSVLTDADGSRLALPRT